MICDLGCFCLCLDTLCDDCVLLSMTHIARSALIFPGQHPIISGPHHCFAALNELAMYAMQMHGCLLCVVRIYPRQTYMKARTYGDIYKQLLYAQAAAAP